MRARRRSTPTAAETLLVTNTVFERPPLPVPNVDLCVPTESLADEICAGIANSAQDATLSSTGRRMFSEVLLSLRDPTDSADATEHAKPGQNKPVVRFEQKLAATIPARTSSVAMDTITAAKHRAAAAAAPGRRMPQSMPHSRAMSSDDSLAEMLASADGSERFDGSECFDGFRVSDMPGIESYGETPVPANARLRRLEDEVLFGVSRPPTAESHGPGSVRAGAGAMLASFDSPASDAGTGRTQILDFAEANDIRSPVATTQLQRRPSARPEIRDVRGILWADTNPTSTAAASADLGAEPPATANKAPTSKPAPKHTASSKTLAVLDSACLHDPIVLARLVHTSPDPRNLIYDAASQFGSMRSRPSLNDPKPKPKPEPESELKPELELLACIS
ncbi:hypothetical protein GGI21_005946, partial [Coemansia aciculifera]